MKWLAWLTARASRNQPSAPSAPSAGPDTAPRAGPQPGWYHPICSACGRRHPGRVTTDAVEYVEYNERCPFAGDNGAAGDDLDAYIATLSQEERDGLAEADRLLDELLAGDDEESEKDEDTCERGACARTGAHQCDGCLARLCHWHMHEYDGCPPGGMFRRYFCTACQLEWDADEERDDEEEEPC